MANMLIATLLFVLSITIFSFSTSFGALERTFLGIDEVFMKQTINATDCSQPYFNTETLESNLESHFSLNLDRYYPMLAYSYTCEYLDGFYEYGEYHLTSVNITLSGSFLSTYKYENTAWFYIKEGESNYG